MIGNVLKKTTSTLYSLYKTAIIKYVIVQVELSYY